jgi:5-formyltetrahydrofolate cyclo-ligase
VQKTKEALRKTLKDELSNVSERQRKEASERVLQLLTLHSLWKRSSTVLFFYPLQDEIDISPLMKAGLAEGKTIALPRYDPSNESYIPCQITNRSDEMCRGRFGIGEPTLQCPVIPPNQLDLILVPGLAFDLSGRRLGRGFGFYDRLLTAVSGTRVGVSYHFQLRPELPWEAHDIGVDCILTPERLIVVQEPPGQELIN